MKIRKTAKAGVLIFACIFLVEFILPEKLVIPVQGASKGDWNHDTFWHEHWGKSGVHKGIDIFSPMGRPVIASTYGIVIFRGQRSLGGNVIAVLGPRWRIHYYSHLRDMKVSPGSFVRTSEKIGTVGNTGNAKGTPSHLHYAILTLVPYLWRWDSSAQGWKKAFFLNPGEELLGT